MGEKIRKWKQENHNGPKGTIWMLEQKMRVGVKGTRGGDKGDKLHNVV